SNESVSVKIKNIRELETAGARVKVFTVDISEHNQVTSMVRKIEEHFGKINGVIHAAGIADRGLIRGRTKEHAETVFMPKVDGAVTLDSLFSDYPLDFLLLCSTVGSLAGTAGQIAYDAANAFLDHFAYYRARNGGTFTISVNWDTLSPLDSANAVTPQEGFRVLQRVLTGEGGPQLAVSTTSLEDRMNELFLIQSQQAVSHDPFGNISSAPKLARPELDTDYVAPISPVEKTLTTIWEDLLGLDQVGIYDDYFQLGGDSLKAVNFSARIHQDLNVEVPISEFFISSNIKGMAKFVEKSGNGTQFTRIPYAEEKEFYVLSSPQERLFILNQLEGKHTGHNIPTVRLMEGDLDIGKITETFNAVIQRHPGLRTTFNLDRGKPVQQIHEQVSFEPDFLDISTLPAEETTPEALDRIVHEFVQPFDLEQAPLMRAKIIKLGPDRHILIID
ncbi:MAG: SDR family oxidoreductase, partial [bacterium]|nr:SDR family oxidoreductase [bacterium]